MNTKFMISVFSKIIIGLTLFWLGFYSGQQFELEKKQENNLVDQETNICGDAKICTPELSLQKKENPTTPETIIVENQTNNSNAELLKVQSQVSLILNFGENNIKSFNNIEIGNNTTVFDVLKKMTSENNLELKYTESGGLGAFIETIDGSKNNFKENKFWQYWVNGKFALVGASSYLLKDGDVVEWKYIERQ